MDTTVKSVSRYVRSPGRLGSYRDMVSDLSVRTFRFSIEKGVAGEQGKDELEAIERQREVQGFWLG